LSPEQSSDELEEREREGVTGVIGQAEVVGTFRKERNRRPEHASEKPNAPAL